jgi:predicted nucleic acid-binding protein
MPEKQWVFDTVVLSNFLIANAAHILEKRYQGRGVITPEVYDELSAGIPQIGRLGYIDKLIENKTFSITPLTRQEYYYFREIITFLGKGEASCIAFAKDNRAIVATDDRMARKQCANMKIRVTGTIGILKASIQDESLNLEQANKILGEMITSGFYSPVTSITDIV